MTLVRKADEVERENYLGLFMSSLIAKVEKLLGDVPYMDLGGMPFPPLWPIFNPYAKWLARRSNVRMMVRAARKTRKYVAQLQQHVQLDSMSHETAAPPPSGTEASGPDDSGSKTRPPGDPVARAVAAAYALRRAGKPVSVRAACKAAGVDRKHLTTK